MTEDQLNGGRLAEVTEEVWEAILPYLKKKKVSLASRFRNSFSPSGVRYINLKRVIKVVPDLKLALVERGRQAACTLACH